MHSVDFQCIKSHLESSAIPIMFTKVITSVSMDEQDTEVDKVTYMLSFQATNHDLSS